MSKDPDQGALSDGEMSEKRDPTELLEPTLAWRGMPAFKPPPPREVRLVFTFETEADRDRLVKETGVVIAKKTKGTWSAWWPPREREDLSSLLFTVDDPGRPTELSPGWKPSELEPEPYEVVLRWDAPTAWAKHLGHRVALEYRADGSLAAALCVDCKRVLPPPEDGTVPEAPDTGPHEGDSDEPSAEGGMIA